MLKAQVQNSHFELMPKQDLSKIGSVAKIDFRSLGL
jgi:hypothetical protein